MAKEPDKKFADAAAKAFGKKAADKEPDAEDPEEGDEGEGDEKDPPGKLGRMAMAAIKQGDPEAFEEAVRKICNY